MNKFKKFGYILSWIPMILLKLSLALLGLPIIAIAIKRWGSDSDDWPRLLAVWSNEEDGYPMWAEKDGIGPWTWYAIRNPVNGLRYWFEDPIIFNVEGWQHNSMEAMDLIDARVDSAYYWRYKGAFAGYRKIWLNDDGTYNEFWIGWKVGSVVPGLGFTLQYRPHRTIGT